MRRSILYAPLAPCVLASCLLAASCAGGPAARGSGFSLEPRDLPEAIDRIVRDLGRALPAGRNRLAVAAFTPTGPSDPETAPRFGDWFAETLAGAARMALPSMKLYERTRLDAVLAENELQLSGLVDERLAQRIGQLAPIDALLAGTYTPLAGNVDVNCRLVDVVTGEVLMSRIERIRTTPDIEALLAPRGAAAAAQPNEPPEDPCLKRADAVRGLLKDLSSPAKVKGVAAAAAEIPFEPGCGEVHLDVLAAFRRAGVRDAGYGAFLMRELARITFPSDDDRARAILTYAAADGVDEAEWQAGLGVMRKSDPRAFSSYLVILLQTNEKQRSETYYAAAFARMDGFMDAVRRGGVGLPVQARVETAFGEMLDAWNYVYATDNRPLAHLYEKHAPGLASDRDLVQRLDSLLSLMYEREADRGLKLKYLGWVTDRFLARAVDETLAGDVFDFLGKFEQTDYRLKHPEELAKAPPEHLPVAVAALRPLFCRIVGLTKFRSQTEDRIDFCLEQGIECPGVVPDPAEAAALVDSRNWTDRLRGAEMLSKMGSRAAPGEASLVARFDDTDGGSGAEVTVFQNLAAETLGNIRTANPRSLALLFDALSSLNNGVADSAWNALANIGRPAVPWLVKGVEGKAGSVQVYCSRALERIGPPAAEALPALRALLSSGNRDIAKAAERAVAAIEGRK
jgi:hypothetical protein